MHQYSEEHGITEIEIENKIANVKSCILLPRAKKRKKRTIVLADASWLHTYSPGAFSCI